jgi:hypothetical protein
MRFLTSSPRWVTESNSCSPGWEGLAAGKFSYYLVKLTRNLSDVSNYLIIFESDYFQAKVFKISSPVPISFPLLRTRMIPSIHFDNQPYFMAIEIHNKPADRMLAPEKQIILALFPKLLP